MKKFIFSLFTVMFFLLTSCSKEDIKLDFSGGWGGPGICIDTSGTGVNTNIVCSFYIPALDFIKLPVNRYFVYKDSATGLLDTVIVRKSTIELSYSPPIQGCGWVNGYYQSIFKLDMTNVPGYDWLNCTMLSNAHPRYDTSNVIDSNFMLTIVNGFLPVFWYPFTSGIVDYGEIKYTYLPTLDIAGITYSEVHKFSSTNWRQPAELGYLKADFYWVKGIGIVKKETTDYYSTKSLLLVSYG